MDKLDIDKLETISTDLSNLSNTVDNDLLKIVCMTNLLQKSQLLIEVN